MLFGTKKLVETVASVASMLKLTVTDPVTEKEHIAQVTIPWAS